MRFPPQPDLPSRLHRTALRAAFALAALSLSPASAAAHDFWLVPSGAQSRLNGTIEIRGQTSSLFPTSLSAVTPDRIASAVVVNGRGSTPLSGLSTSGRSLFVRYRPVEQGQHLFAVQLHPRLVRETPASLRRYMQLEGAPEALARYEREGRLPPIASRDSLTRRYAKYAKTFADVGPAGSRTFGHVVGHPLEFVPLADPSAARPGDTLAVRLLLGGQPLAEAHVHAGAGEAGAAALEDTAAARRAAGRDVELVTDANGVLRVPVTTAGLWNLRTLQIIPAPAGSGADWDVHWATVVFHVAAAGGSTSAAGTDSADVAGVVGAYHHALSTGDSAAALALLAPDAVILESGGMETRAEYRNHHLPGDIAFARAVRAERAPVRVAVRGDVAWAWSTSVTQGNYRGRAVNSAGAELMVLTRTNDGRWLISAIHWSSRARRS